MSVNISGAPSAAQAKDDLSRLEELRARSAGHGHAPKDRAKRVAYICVALLLMGNIVLGVLLVSGMSGAGSQSHAQESMHEVVGDGGDDAATRLR